MKPISLTKETVEKISQALIKAGYSEHSKQMYMRYTKSYGDSAFIHHSHNIIRCTNNTEAEKTITNILGLPNGVASESQDDGHCSWFLNGYNGKAGTKIA